MGFAALNPSYALSFRQRQQFATLCLHDRRLPGRARAARQECWN